MIAAYARHPFALLALVAAAIAFVWLVLGLQHRLPPSPLGPNERLGCVAYAPSAEITAEALAVDLAAIAAFATCIRTFGGENAERVLTAARAQELRVLQGIEIGASSSRNEAAIARAAGLAKAHSGIVEALVVGTESVSKRTITASALVKHLRALRTQTKVPLTYADVPSVWMEHDLLAESVDAITLLVPLYDARFPVSAADAARHALDWQAAIAARYPDKPVVLGDAGWPSEGRMREGALPSTFNQARFVHELLTLARARRVEVMLFEAVDRAARVPEAGRAAGHFGLLRAEAREPKFAWGGSVSNHPLWFMQAVIGILLALVTFAAAFVAARSGGVAQVVAAPWPSVAVVALGGGLFIGWAVADLPAEYGSVFDWAQSGLLLILAFVSPPVCAAAIARGTAVPSFATLLDPLFRRNMPPLERGIALLLIVSLAAAIHAALVLLFETAVREIPFAVFTGPAVALLSVALLNPHGQRRESYAEPAAALLLTACAVAIVMRETFWNWQAVWFAAALLALAAASWRAPGAQRKLSG